MLRCRRQISRTTDKSRPYEASSRYLVAKAEPASRRWGGLVTQRPKLMATNSSPDKMNVFNREIKKLHKDRAATWTQQLRASAPAPAASTTDAQEDSPVPGFPIVDIDFLRNEFSQRLMDRLDDVAEKHKFEVCLDLGAHAGQNLKYIQHRDDIKQYLLVDSSDKMLHRDAEFDHILKIKPTRIVADEELLPFPEKSVDLIVSNLSLHWVNDLPGVLTQCRKVLKGDGFFIASMFCEGSLQELRNSFVLAEEEREGGISPHISPFAGIADIGNLMSRAGFNLISVDKESVTVRYKNAFVLMNELQQMAESNAVLTRRPFVNKDTIMAAAAVYQAMYGEPDGSVPATFHVVYMAGWAPSPTQAKPLKRGSATHSLKDIGNASGNLGDPTAHTCAKHKPQ